jgi:hypothetical protein
MVQPSVSCSDGRTGRALFGCAGVKCGSWNPCAGVGRRRGHRQWRVVELVWQPVNGKRRRSSTQRCRDRAGRQWRHRAIRPRAHGFCRRLCGFARPSAATAAGRSPRLPLALALQRFRRFVKDFYRCGDPSRTCKNDPHATPMLQCSRSFHGKSSIMLRPLLKGRNAHSSEGPDLACLTAGSAHVHHQFQQSGGGTHDE